jgi:uncharacterized protein
MSARDSVPVRAWEAGDFSPPLAIQQLILQPTPFCNIACDYCYLAERDSARFMSVEVVEATTRNAVASGLLGAEVDVIWHAGEPLVAPRAFYDEAIVGMARIAGPGIVPRHSIQTNGLLIDADWCELFRRHGIRVGVSLDGPAFLHDRHRRTRDGRPTHARVMQGIETLQRHGIEFDVIAVVTSDSLDHPDAIIDFFLEAGIAEIGFNVDEQEGVHRTSTLSGEDGRFERFLGRVFERAGEVAERLRVREFEQAVARVAAGLPETTIAGARLPANPQVLPFATTTVDWTGGFSCFSPELIDQRHPGYGGFVLGNVLQDSMLGALRTERFRSVFEDILAGVGACRNECPYFSLCGGGAPVNKLNEHGSFRSTETRYCRQVVKAPLALALAGLEATLGSAGS